ncbi:hypothetical protein BV25DRAFT_727855 [Artomyces pyxidatus]|uniref:Uncharacterized protein n=1 Tax=Artomyces pyxidatus TaxID=48021 RepID=A0ACB8T0K5_9AGAM|nr:hypothetical protein BV25DRAFT_727855 [Artomyces pyxidatus]
MRDPKLTPVTTAVTLDIWGQSIGTSFTASVARQRPEFNDGIRATAKTDKILTRNDLQQRLVSVKVHHAFARERHLSGWTGQSLRPMLAAYLRNVGPACFVLAPSASPSIIADTDYLCAVAIGSKCSAKQRYRIAFLCLEDSLQDRSHRHRARWMNIQAGL